MKESEIHDALAIASSSATPTQVVEKAIAASVPETDVDLVGSITLSIDGLKQTFGILQQVEYDADDLSTAFNNQAMKMTYWTALVAKLAHRYREEKSKLERIAAQVATDIRSGKVDIGYKVTESVIKEQQTIHPIVCAQQTTMERMELTLNIAKAIVEGLKHRKDMVYLEGLLKNTTGKFIPKVAG